MELCLHFLFADLDVEQLELQNSSMVVGFGFSHYTHNIISERPTLTRSFVSLKVSELLLFLSALRNFFFRNLVHAKLSNWQVMESHLQVILRLPTEASHQDDAVGDSSHPSISCLLVVSNLKCHRSVCLLV